ncbi:MAG TPA: hypothetical protein VFV72_09765 [Candidatus Limnocylindrales bacterium]|nr:hypothetical protein [Candidatus Limnocylindrales bacterium]
MPNHLRFPLLSSLLVVGLLAAACSSASTPASASPPPASAAPPATAAPPSVAADGPLLTIETVGGHCIQGSCDSTITIDSNGKARQLKPDAKDLGTVPADIVDALVVEIDQADFEAIKSKPFTDTCPIAFDGQQFIYTFTAGGGSERIDSCAVAVDQESPLFIAVHAALASVTQG